MKRKLSEELREEEYQKAFQTFDNDGNGFLSADELRRIMTGPGGDLTEDDTKNILKDADIGAQDTHVNYKGMEKGIFQCWLTNWNCILDFFIQFYTGNVLTKKLKIRHTGSFIFTHIDYFINNLSTCLSTGLSAFLNLNLTFYCNSRTGGTDDV